MTYSNYATKLNNNSNIIQQLLTNIDNIDLESSQEGNASKKQIEEKLSNITTRYSEQYVDLPATTIENTVNLFTESQNKLQDIDNYLTIKATPRNGDKISSDNAGTVQLLKRTSADGQEDWRNYLTGKSEQYVNRNDPNTFIATDHYDWVITGDKVTNGYITLSQTAFHSTDNAPEYKSMYRIKVKVIN